MTPHSTGIHHVTAIAGDPQRNLDFYVGLLGRRLVKRTVNFDDPGSYHLYYGDEEGRPGSILTFFPWPGARRGSRGAGQATVTAFSVPEGSLGFWRDRLSRVHRRRAPRRARGRAAASAVARAAARGSRVDPAHAPDAEPRGGDPVSTPTPLPPHGGLTPLEAGRPAVDADAALILVHGRGASPGGIVEITAALLSEDRARSS